MVSGQALEAMDEEMAIAWIKAQNPVHIISATAYTDGTHAMMCGVRMPYADAVDAGHVVGNYAGKRGATCFACIAAHDAASYR